ncbi:hypothetical protein EON77_19080 [bacterium]|nr:MAG: hypothetical protein EON77_19080 [bacterium]
MDRIPNARIAELVGPASGPGSTVSPAKSAEAKRLGEEFAGILGDRLGGEGLGTGRVGAERPGGDRLKVSGHAQTRLDSRGITLGDAEWSRVMAGVDRAAAKGAKESLVLMDGTALVVSVKNRTLITAVDAESSKENVFTNIDSAVIV